MSDRVQVAHKLRDVEEYLYKRVAALGGEMRRLRWIVDDGGPDALVLLPGRAFMAIIHSSAYGLPAYRRVVAERFLDAGVHIEILDSTAAVNAALRCSPDHHYDTEIHP